MIDALIALELFAEPFLLDFFVAIKHSFVN
jgi:hypothetical protein